MQFTFIFLSEINKFYYIILKSYFVLLITLRCHLLLFGTSLSQHWFSSMSDFFNRVEDSMFTCVWMPFLSVTVSSECGV